MCGIAGLIDLTGQRRPLPPGALQAMADSIIHRGPDEDGFFERPGLGLANRRLSIVGLSDGKQPIANEDGSVSVVFNGEFFDYPEEKTRLEARGHRFRTHCDTELIPHNWEDCQEGMFDHLKGQFAIALWDEKRQRVILARDRFGICPLYWAKQDGWLLFGSEIKAILASGLIEPKADVRGISQVFNFFAIPGPPTCFAGIQLLQPGRFLKIQLGEPGRAAEVSQHKYFEVDFPDLGQEERGDEKKLVDRFEEVLYKAVEKRLRADVPVVSYLSGGVDSSMVVAMASKIRGSAIPTFTIQIDDPKLDELDGAMMTARQVGSEPVVLRFGSGEALGVYPRLVWAAESPVVDTSCGALLMLAQQVHSRGYKVALTGEGADEWLISYPWFKSNRLLSYFDFIPGLNLSYRIRRLFLRLNGFPNIDENLVKRVRDTIAGPNAWLDVYGLMSTNKLRFFSKQTFDTLGDHLAYGDLELNLDRMRRWHPLHRALYLGSRVHLPGLLLNAKGDRISMHSSLEQRYAFLDEDVCSFLAPLHPDWKMKGFKDKYILRRLAERWLPRPIAWRTKGLFRAPFDSLLGDHVPPWVYQLVSEESLQKTGYFDPVAVRHWWEAFRTLKQRSYTRNFLEMGLVAVVSTQLWHQTFIDSSLADLPSRSWEKKPAQAMGSNGVKLSGSVPVSQR